MGKDNSITKDEQIIALLLNRDPDGLSLLYDQYAKPMYGLIFQVLRNTPAAEEVLQDAMMKIWNKSASYDPAKGNLINWCLQIARNTAIDRLRLKRINASSSELTENLSQQLQTAALNPETIGVRDLLVNLQPEHRDILELLYFQGYSQSEAAEALNIPLGTLKTRCYAAINQLSAMFT